MSGCEDSLLAARSKVIATLEIDDAILMHVRLLVVRIEKTKDEAEARAIDAQMDDVVLVRPVG